MKLPAYLRTKPSGVEWLGDVPEHWKIKRLKMSAELRDRKVEADPDEPLPYIGLENIESWTGRLLPIDDTVIPAGTANAFENKHTLFGKLRPYLAKACNPEFDGLCSTELLVLEPAELDRRNLLYSLLNDGFIKLVDSSTFGSKMPRANWEFIGNCVVPIAPPDEQREIADFLDRETARLDTLVGKKRELIEKLKEKRTALISRTVTKGLPAEAAAKAGLNPRPKLKPSGIEWLGDIPKHWEMVRLGRRIMLQRGVDIIKDEQSEGTVPVVSSGGISSFHNYALITGPGVIVGRKGTAGAVYYIGEDYWPHDTTLYVREFRGSSPRFVYYKLLSMDLASYDTGSANPTVNRNRVHPEIVSWPPISEQAAIADYVDRETAKLDRMVEKVEAAIEKLQEYRTALITAAVTGKIDVRKAGRNDSDPPLLTD